MRIGIIGSGNMGRTVGIVLAERGHEVFFGGRDPAQAEEAARLAPRGASHGSNDDAAAFGEVVFWTVRDAAPGEVLRDPDALCGKIVLDPNNGPVPADGTLGPAPGVPSRAERLAAALPGARVVKAFNTMAQEVFELAGDGLARERVSAFVAGDDEDAKHVAAGLAREIGFEPVDAGPLASARSLEGIADFVRTMMGRGLGVLATISVHVVPTPSGQRLGGRRASRLR